MAIQVLPVEYGSKSYDDLLALRNDILRKPIGLDIYTEDLSRDIPDHHYGVYDADQLVATFILHRLNDKLIRIRQVAVRADLQGKGIGSTMLAHAQTFALELGFTHMVLHSRRAAIGFYEKNGYKLICGGIIEVGHEHYKMKKCLKEWVDLSITFTATMPTYGGDSEARLYQNRFMDKDGYNGYQIESNLHVGTHIDMPMHMSGRQGFACDFPLEHFIGRGVLIDAKGERVIDYCPEFEKRIRKGDIVLFWTGHSDCFGQEGYYRQHPIVADEMARFLARKEIRGLGIDGPSPDVSPYNVHSILFEQGIYIVEGLMGLEQLEGYEDFEVMVLPLKLEAEASLIRAVARIK